MAGIVVVIMCVCVYLCVSVTVLVAAWVLHVAHASHLQKHGLKVYLREPNSFTPVRGTRKALLLGGNSTENRRQIAQFSHKDAEVHCDCCSGVCLFGDY